MLDGYPKHSLTEGVQCWKCYYIKKWISEEQSLGILDFSQGWEESWGQTGYTPPPRPNAQCPFKLIYFLNRGLYILVRRYQNHFWQCFQMIKSDQALLTNWFGNTILIPLHNQLQGLGRANSIKMRRKTCSVITNPFPNLTGGWIIARCAIVHISLVSRVCRSAWDCTLETCLGGWLSCHGRAESHVWIEWVADLDPHLTASSCQLTPF